MHLNKIKIFIIRELSIQMFFFFLFISCSNAKFRKIIFFNFQTPFMRSNKIKIQQPEEYLSSITNCCLILIDLRNMLQLINDFNFIISLQDSMPQKNDNKKLFSSSTFNFFSSKTRFWSLMEMCIHREKKNLELFSNTFITRIVFLFTTRNFIIVGHFCFSMIT